MKIEIVVDPSRPAPAASLASRVAPAPAAATAAVESAPRLVPFGLVRALPSFQSDANIRSYGFQRTGGRPRRGRGGGRGGGRRNERPPKSAADLDAEMEVWSSFCHCVKVDVHCFVSSPFRITRRAMDQLLPLPLLLRVIGWLC